MYTPSRKNFGLNAYFRIPWLYYISSILFVGGKMMKNTFETAGWSVEEDNLLGETMLEVISNGGTTREGLEKFVNQSDIRTMDASKFRFFTVIKKDPVYEERYLQAKNLGSASRKGKNKKDTKTVLDLNKALNIKRNKSEPINNNQNLNIDDNIEIKPEDFYVLAKKFEEQYKRDSSLEEINKKNERIAELEKKNEELAYKLKDFTRELDDLKEELLDKTEQLKIISTAFGMINNIKEQDKNVLKGYSVDTKSGLLKV